MNKTIEIKNKYRMTLWEALAVMQLNPGFEFEFKNNGYRCNFNNVLEVDWLKHGIWKVSIAIINDLIGDWYPVYPEGSAEWAVVQMYKGKIILVGKCYYRIKNNELQVWSVPEQTWDKYNYAIDEFASLSNLTFKVVDSVQGKEPETGSFEWAKIQLEKPIPEGYGLTWGARATYFRKNNEDYEVYGQISDFKWKKYHNPLAENYIHSDGFIIEMLPIKKQTDKEKLIEIQSALRVYLHDMEDYVDASVIYELNNSAAGKIICAFAKEGT